MGRLCPGDPRRFIRSYLFFAWFCRHRFLEYYCIIVHGTLLWDWGPRWYCWWWSIVNKGTSHVFLSPHTLNKFSFHRKCLCVSFSPPRSFFIMTLYGFPNLERYFACKVAACCEKRDAILASHACEIEEDYGRVTWTNLGFWSKRICIYRRIKMGKKGVIVRNRRGNWLSQCV